ncbi:MAG: hypothetical protein ACYTEL_21940 [Planctomycetota bacterium]|jgi:tetratricopeptide (TPR) repeat protein
MDIRKDDILSSVFVNLAALTVILQAAEMVSLSGTQRAARQLIATYQLAPLITPEQATSAVARLEKALADCNDRYLASRIKYRIGVIHFKAGAMEASNSTFLQIAHDLKCPQLISICSLNMIGQISRLTGEAEQALEAFNQAASRSKPRLSAGPQSNNYTAIARLCCLALFSSAEICQLHQDYAKSITEYGRLLRVLDETQIEEIEARYAPLARDRISQMHLCLADVDKYVELAHALILHYPGYCRTPMIELEIECVKFLRRASPGFQLVNGSFSAPAQVIACIKGSEAEISGPSLVAVFDRICEKYRHSRGWILLQYHYAWLLDTLDRKHEAVKVLADVLATNVPDPHGQAWKQPIARTIGEYAAIQSAIMLGEMGDYAQSLKVLDSLQPNPDNSHISEIAEDVTNGIKTLKIEVPKE